MSIRPVNIKQLTGRIRDPRCSGQDLPKLGSPQSLHEVKTVPKYTPGSTRGSEPGPAAQVPVVVLLGRLLGVDQARHLTDGAPVGVPAEQYDPVTVRLGVASMLNLLSDQMRPMR